MPSIDSKSSVLERGQRKLLDQLPLLKVILDITYASHAGSGAGYRRRVSKQGTAPKPRSNDCYLVWQYWAIARAQRALRARVALAETTCIGYQW